MTPARAKESERGGREAASSFSLSSIVAGVTSTRDGVLVLGEVLCDLFPPRAGVSFSDARALTPLLGGAPANVAVQCARLGVRTAMVSAVGADPLGARLVKELNAEGVDTSRVALRLGWRTGVTLVEVDENGERRFYPLADRRADLSLSERDIDPRQVKQFQIVHTGTVGLREPAPRRAHARLVAAAKKSGALLSLDVNLRPGMYRSRDDMLRRARSAIRQAHIVKATADEARALLGATGMQPAAIADKMFAKLAGRDTGLFMLTLDAGGAYLATRTARASVAAPEVRVIDATGAGDAFVGAALAWLCTRVKADSLALASLDAAELTSLGVRACAAGSAACTALGATSAMMRSSAS